MNLSFIAVWNLFLLIFFLCYSCYTMVVCKTIYTTMSSACVVLYNPLGLFFVLFTALCAENDV